MKIFRKRTLALVLASVITVAGSFAAENYKNSLMGMKFESKGGGNVSLVLETKTAFTGNITPVKKDVNTYVIMLPEMNSQASTPLLDKVSAEIESVNIRTMPYTNAGSGYTRLTIKTYPNIQMSASSVIYVPAPPTEPKSIENKSVQSEETPQSLPDLSTIEKKEVQSVEQIQKVEKPKPQNQIKEEVMSSMDVVEQLPVENNSNIIEAPQETIDTSHYGSNDSNELLLLILGVLLVIVSSAYFFVKAKNKMENILGENFEIDTSDEEEKPKEEKVKQSKKGKKGKKVVEAVDLAFEKAVLNEMKSAPSVREMDEDNILDLDELFQGQKNTTEEAVLYEEEDKEENEALNDFLSGFSFSDEVEEFHIASLEHLEIDKILENDNLVFTNDDVEKINNLLNMEITDNTIDDLKKNVTVPIKTPSKLEILENLVTTYKISQDITFKPSDMKILRDLINIEINQDFLDSIRNTKDLEIVKKDNSQNLVDTDNKDATLLNVSSMLPDLDKAVQEQAGRRIECQVKPETVYYNEGFEFEKIAVDNLLSESSFTEGDTSYKETEIKYVDENYEVSTLSVDNLLAESSYQDTEKSYKITEIQYSDSSYENKTLNVDGLLPSMEDVMKNPNQYISAKKEEEPAKEEDLLNRLLNVTFKPFADEEQSYGDFDARTLEQTINDEEIKKEEEIKPVESSKKISLQKQESFKKIARPDLVVSKQVSKPVQTRVSSTKERVALAQERPKQGKKENPVNKNIAYSKCLLDGVSYTIVSSNKFDENTGCHLAKSSERIAILGYVGEEISVLKEYETVSNERLMSRLSETLPNGIKRYLVRVGANKIVVDVKDNKINYLMDLC